MSFLYQEKTQKVIKWTFGALAILIIVSMIVAYAPGLVPGFY